MALAWTIPHPDGNPAPGGRSDIELEYLVVTMAALPLSPREGVPCAA